MTFLLVFIFLLFYTTFAIPGKINCETESAAKLYVPQPITSYDVAKTRKRSVSATINLVRFIIRETHNMHPCYSDTPSTRVAANGNLIDASTACQI